MAFSRNTIDLFDSNRCVVGDTVRTLSFVRTSTSILNEMTRFSFGLQTQIFSKTELMLIKLLHKLKTVSTLDLHWLHCITIPDLLQFMLYGMNQF